MQYNRLGKSDLKVSAVGLGCMSLPLADLGQSERIIQQAFDCGIHYFDTADLYDRGANEELVGRAIASFRRDSIVATKVGNQWSEEGAGWTWNPSGAYILNAVEQSLRRLRTDYIDLYQLHGGTLADNFEEIVETFESLLQAGKIRAYSISSIRPNVFTRYLGDSGIVSNMMQYSVLDSRPEEYIDRFVQADVSIVARGSLAQGLLLDKLIEKPYLGHSLVDTQRIKQEIADVAAEYAVSKEAIALKYVLQQQVVASAVVGVRTPEQLAGLRSAYDELQSLPSECMVDLQQRIPKIHYQDHRS